MTYHTDARPLYHAALDGGYALPAFNVCSLEMARGCLEAADAARKPVILQTYPADIEQASPHVFAQLIRALADEVSVPVALHLDHGRDVNQVIACLRAGYGSVMFDGQGLPFGETLEMTAHLAAIAHASGAALEVSAESFGVPGADDNVLDTTDPGQARALREAGADLIACAVGSEHGHASRLDLTLLSGIQARAGGPLVLHGGSGVHPDDLRAALAFGVTKVNVGSALYRAVRAAWMATPGQPTHRAGYASIRAAVRDAAAPYLDFLHPPSPPARRNCS